MNPSVYPTASSPQPTGASSMGFSSGPSATSPARRQNSSSKKITILILIISLILIVGFFVFNIFRTKEINSKERHSFLSLLRNSLPAIEELELKSRESESQLTAKSVFIFENYKIIKEGITKISEIKSSLDNSNYLRETIKKVQNFQDALDWNYRSYNDFFIDVDPLFLAFFEISPSQAMILARNQSYRFRNEAETIYQWSNKYNRISTDIKAEACLKSLEKINNKLCDQLLLSRLELTNRYINDDLAKNIMSGFPKLNPNLPVFSNRISQLIKVLENEK